MKHVKNKFQRRSGLAGPVKRKLSDFQTISSTRTGGECGRLSNGSAADEGFSSVTSMVGSFDGSLMLMGLPFP